MAAMEVGTSGDPTEALDAAGAFLLTDPVRHSIFLTMLQEGVPGRFWWAADGSDTVIGFAMQAPAGFSAGVAAGQPEAVDVLCDHVMAGVPDLSGVIAEASVAARFAGRWAEVMGVPVRPFEAHRVYQLDAVVPPDARVEGRLRPATIEDRPLLVPWAAGFLAEVGGLPEDDPAAVIDRHLVAGRMWLWDDDGPATMASSTAPVGGVSRVAFVYTPPERRRQGYAGACVAALSERLLASGADRCMLYAQLHNPTSNRIYVRMGYRPVTEILLYRFGSDT